jgi:hypothetical protein
MDPDDRPLFIQIATMDWLDAHGEKGGRDEALRRLIARSTGQLGARVGDLSSDVLARNVQIFTTALGGLSLASTNMPHFQNTPRCHLACCQTRCGFLGR